MREPQDHRPGIVYIVTSGISITLLRGQLEFMRERGYRTSLILGDEPPREWIEEHQFAPEAGEIVVVPMTRGISPLLDIISVIRLWRKLRELHPDVVNVSTPKAGLVGGIAAFLARVPCRIYLLRGLRFETVSGPQRWLLRFLEQFSCTLSHRVLAVSESLRRRAIETGIAPAEKIALLAHGSSNGVDVDRFLPGSITDEEIARLRRQLEIPDRAVVIGFVGRMTRDKGIAELIAAFETLRSEFPNLYLLLVGDFEAIDAVDREVRAQLLNAERIVRTGFVTDVAPCYRIIDILALPTHREGFPNACLEAQAAGLPVVTTRATGAIDSVRDGITGMAIDVGDIPALTRALRLLVADPELRWKMGAEGKKWVSNCFRREIVWEALLAQYQARLRARPRRAADVLKRSLDLFIAVPALILLAPLMALISLLVMIFLGRPVLFSQKRPGLHGHPFLLRKFRTMNMRTGPDGKLLPDAERLTRFGRLLRSTSLDELPQLLNVLRGDMSLVGPRPLLVAYLPRYTAEQMRRHEVRPGITGLAQIKGRNAVTWEMKFDLDVWYVDHWSFWLDLKILWLTMLKVIRQEGIKQTGHATMPEFTGTPAPPVETK